MTSDFVLEALADYYYLEQLEWEDDASFEADQVPDTVVYVDANTAWCPECGHIPNAHADSHREGNHV